MILPLALPLLLFGFVLLLLVFVFMVEIRVLAYAYRKIGVRPRYMFLVLLLSLVGSHFNIPLYSVTVPRLAPPEEVTVMVALALLLVSRTDVAVRVTVGLAGTVPGAV